MFIVLEGLDGSGKSTQLKTIENLLKEKNVKYIITREPGGFNCELAEKIRDIILNNEMSDYTRVLLYAASRQEHAKQIKQWLDEGYVVVSDRYIYSSLAYQTNCISEMDEVLRVNRFTDLPKPDLVLHFNIDVDTYIERKSNRANLRELDVMEKKPLEYFEKNIRNYINAYMHVMEDKDEKTVVKIINACKDIETVSINVKEIINETIQN